jgi:hypothetical protein
LERQTFHLSSRWGDITEDAKKDARNDKSKQLKGGSEKWMGGHKKGQKKRNHKGKEMVEEWVKGGVTSKAQTLCENKSSARKREGKEDIWAGKCGEDNAHEYNIRFPLLSFLVRHKYKQGSQ